MAIFPLEWLPWLVAAFVALLIDQAIFGGKYLSQILSFSNTSYSWELRPGARYKGVPVTHFEIAGTVTKLDGILGSKEVLAGYLKTPQGERMRCEVPLIPIQAIKHWNVEPFEILDLNETMQRIMDENGELKYRVAAANTRANFAFANALDYTTKITTYAGEWAKNIGSTVVVAQKTREGYQYSQNAAKQEAAQEE